MRRRREGKTDYYARKRLVAQEKGKYNSPKYRFVVRITSGKVICQIVYATLVGDRVMCEANSRELTRHGLTAGYTNYAAAYATGLLLARRLLKAISLDKMYIGQAAASGEYFNVEDDIKERRPFKAILDVGLAFTTVGRKVFAALKGACDGGLYIPHNTKRFPGFSKEGDNDAYDAAVHRERIFGVHVDKYYAQLKEDSPEDFARQFSQAEKCLTDAKVKSFEALFTKIHAAVRANPDRVVKAAVKNPSRDHKKFVQRKISKDEKRVRIAKKFEIARA